MADDTRVQRLVMRLESDQQSATQTQQDIQRYLASLREVEQRQETLTREEEEARTAETRLTQARQAAERAARDTAQETERATRSQRESNEETERGISLLQRYREAAERAADARNGGGRGGSRLDSVDRLGSVGSQILGGLGQGEAANAAGLLGDVAGAFSSLNPVMLGLTAVTVGVTAGVAALTAEQNRIKEATERRFAIERELFAFIQTSTTQEIEDRREDVLESIRLEQLLHDQRVAERDALLNTFNDFQRGMVVLGRADLVSGEFVALDNAVKESLGTLGDLWNQVGLLNEAWLANEGAAEDLTAAAEQQAEADRLAAEEQANALRAEFAFRMQAAALRDAGSSEQLQAIYRQNQAEYSLNEERIRRLTPLASASEAVATEVEQLTARNEELTAQTDLLRQAVEPVITQREREAAAAERQTDATSQLFDALQVEVEAREAVLQAANAYNDALAEHARNVAKIAADLREQEAAIQAEAAADQAERERQYAIDRGKVAEELRERLIEIEQQGAQAFAYARARRDVVAAIMAQQQARDEAEAAEKEAEKRLKELDEQLVEQNRIQQQRLDEQLRNARQAAERALRLEYDRAQTELNTRYLAYQQAQVALQNAEQQRFFIQQYYYSLMIEAAYQAGQSQVAAYQAGAATGQLYADYYGTGGGATPTAYTTTTPVTAGGGQPPSIIVQGQTRRGIERQTIRLIREVWAD